MNENENKTSTTNQVQKTSLSSQIISAIVSIVFILSITYYFVNKNKK